MVSNDDMKYAEALHAVQDSRSDRHPQRVELDELCDITKPSTQTERLVDNLFRRGRPSYAEPPGHGDDPRPGLMYAETLNGELRAALASLPSPNKLTRGAPSPQMIATNPFILKLSGNVLVVAETGNGGAMLAECLAAQASTAGASVDMVREWAQHPALRQLPFPPGARHYGADADSPEELKESLRHTDRNAHRLVIIEFPEWFRDPGPWWRAIAPLLRDPHASVIVHTTSAASVPAEVDRLLAARVMMGTSLHDEAGVVRVLGDVTRKVHKPMAGARGTGVIRQGEDVTEFLLGT